MNTYAKLYTESLYPLQDGVIKIIRSLPTPFYLTGGTALGRGYYNHRYSDVLDLFVNDDPDFIQYVSKFLSELRPNFTITTEVEAHDYLQIHAHQGSISLKIDLVNDVAVHYGEFIEHPLLGKIDSIINILSNKITASYRYEPKDVVDIREICRNFQFTWSDIIQLAKNKEAGVAPPLLSDIIGSIPIEFLSQIKWAFEVDYDLIKRDLQQIAFDILRGEENTLYRDGVGRTGTENTEKKI